MNLESNKSVVIAPARYDYAPLPVATMLTGYSVEAIQCEIHCGEWQGRERLDALRTNA